MLICSFKQFSAKLRLSLTTTLTVYHTIKYNSTFHYTYTVCNRIICLSAPYIFLIVSSMHRTVILCPFWCFHILHKTLHRLHIHLCGWHGRTSTLRNSTLPSAGVCVIMPPAIKWKSGQPSGKKSEQWTSATHWQRY